MDLKEYDVFILAKDLNPVIIKGMTGTILMVYNENSFEVEFLDQNGYNFCFDDKSTFVQTVCQLVLQLFKICSQKCIDFVLSIIEIKHQIVCRLVQRFWQLLNT